MIVGIPILTQGMIPTGPASAAAGPVVGVTVLSAVPVGTDRIRLTLVPPADADYVTCRIYRATVGGQFEYLRDLATGTYDDTAVVVERVYYYLALPVNADDVPGTPSRVAYARCVSWAAVDFAFTNDTVDPLDLDLDSTFGRLLYRTCQLISELEIFVAVLPFMKMPAVWQAPACVVAVGDDPKTEETNIYTETKYQMRIGFVLAGEDGGRLALQALSLRQKIKKAFEGTQPRKLVFADVPGHYDTNLVVSTPAPFAELEGGPLYYNAGLTIEYLVREART